MSPMAITIILKVQKPLSSNMPDAPYLVYAAGKRFMTHVPRADIPDAVIAALGDDPKGYFKATLKNEEWILGERVADQDW